MTRSKAKRLADAQARESQEIVIQRAWLEQLIQIAQKVEDSVGDNFRDSLKYNIPQLLGYISSAKFIIKRNTHGTQRSEDMAEVAGRAR